MEPVQLEVQALASDEVQKISHITEAKVHEPILNNEKGQATMFQAQSIKETQAQHPSTKVRFHGGRVGTEKQRKD